MLGHCPVGVLQHICVCLNTSPATLTELHSPTVLCHRLTAKRRLQVTVTTAGDDQMGQGVGGHVGHRGVGRKLQHHDDILLHLVLEHERTLWKETLLSR